MSSSDDSSKSQSSSPPNSFHASGANISNRLARTSPVQQRSQPSSTADIGTQTTHHAHTPSVTFSNRIEVRGPEGTVTGIPGYLPMQSTSPSSNSVEVQTGSEGPPNVPPGNPPAVAAPAPGDDEHGQQQQSNNPPTPTGPPPGGPPGGPPGVPGPYLAQPIPFMNMNQ